MSSRRFSNYPSRISDVGVIFDLAIHDVDLLLYMAESKAKMVFATGGKSKNELHEDFSNIQIVFEDGKIGLCETNWLSPMKVRQLNITTTDSYLSVDHTKQEIKILSSKFGKDDIPSLESNSSEVSEKLISVTPKEPLLSELVDFLSSIHEKKKPLVSGEDGLEAVKIVESALISLNEKIVYNL